MVFFSFGKFLAFWFNILGMFGFSRNSMIIKKNEQLFFVLSEIGITVCAVLYKLYLALRKCFCFSCRQNCHHVFGSSLIDNKMKYIAKENSDGKK